MMLSCTVKRTDFMAGFKKTINLDSSMINGMTPEQKRECVTEIERRRKTAWRYSCIFCIGLMAYIFLYDLLSVMYSISAQRTVVQLSGFMYLIPVIVAAPSFFAHMMNGKWVLAAVLAYMLSILGTAITGEWLNFIIAPFLVVGAVLYFRLSSCCEMYDALSKQEGFPEFYTLEHGAALAREIIERSSKKEEKSLSPLTELAISAEKNKNKKILPDSEIAEGEENVTQQH